MAINQNQKSAGYVAGWPRLEKSGKNFFLSGKYEVVRKLVYHVNSQIVLKNLKRLLMLLNNSFIAHSIKKRRVYIF